MTNEYIEVIKKGSKESLLFFITLFLFQLSFFLLPWFCNLLFYIILLLLVKKEQLLALYAVLSFFNIMNIEAIPFWASLVSSYCALLIICLRIGKFKRKVSALFFIPALLQVLILVSFFSKTLGEYFLMTGIKSSLQLIFVLLTIQIVTIIPDRYIIASKLFFENAIFSFLISYTIVSYILSNSQERFEGGTGAQGLALQLSILIAYLCGTQRFNRNVQFFIVIILFLTGSRTYLLLSILILAYDYLKKSTFRLKVIILANLVAIVMLLIALLPYSNSRFNYTSDQFLGSFWGRFHNYKEGLELIEQHPVTGNGMGAMLKVLENWVSQEGRSYYLAKGDTTIMHNEYLRILIEIGFLGFIIVLYGTYKIWRKCKSYQIRYMMFIFLIASLLENTLTMYTTGTLFFIVLMIFATHSGASRERHMLNKVQPISHS